jgi:hypothetical protein
MPMVLQSQCAIERMKRAKVSAAAYVVHVPALRILRRASNPNAASPDAKSGSAAGSGVSPPGSVPVTTRVQVPSVVELSAVSKTNALQKVDVTSVHMASAA